MNNDHETTLKNNYHAPLTPSMDNRRRAINSRNLQLAHHADGKVAATGRDLDEEILGDHVPEEAVTLHDDWTLTPAWAQPRRTNDTRHHGMAGETWGRIDKDISIHNGGSK